MPKMNVCCPCSFFFLLTTSVGSSGGIHFSHKISTAAFPQTIHTIVKIVGFGAGFAQEIP